MVSNPVELLPCPFCGNDGRGIHLVKDRETVSPYYFAWCGDCDAHGPGNVTSDLAIAGWNRRTPPPDASPIVPLPATAPTRG